VVFDQATALRRRLAEEPMDFLVRHAPLLLWEARLRLADFLGTDAHRLVFTANVTASINTVAAALCLAAPGEILLTDNEYGAMHWCWERTARRQGLTLRTFALPTMPETPGAIVEAFSQALSERTRVLFFSHVLSPTGLVLPAREICAEARRRGVLTVIDGAHGPAMIPLEIDALGCDYYGGNCHKWLLAPTGSGFLVFAPGSEERLQPLQVSWGWHYDRNRLDQPDEFGSTPRMRAYEFEGTRDLCPWLAIPTAIYFQAALGWQSIRNRIRELTCYVRERFSRVSGLELGTPPDTALHGAVTAFRLPPGTDPVALRRLLWERHRVEAPIIERPDQLLIRISTHFYNTEAEIDRLAEALEADV
jgi:isopenicillin-N epimerase